MLKKIIAEVLTMQGYDGTYPWDMDLIVNEDGKFEFIFNKDHHIKKDDRLVIDLSLTINRFDPGHVTHIE